MNWKGRGVLYLTILVAATGGVLFQIRSLCACFAAFLFQHRAAGVLRQQRTPDRNVSRVIQTLSIHFHSELKWGETLVERVVDTASNFNLLDWFDCVTMTYYSNFQFLLVIHFLLSFRAASSIPNEENGLQMDHYNPRCRSCGAFVSVIMGIILALHVPKHWRH